MFGLYTRENIREEIDITLKGKNKNKNRLYYFYLLSEYILFIFHDIKMNNFKI